MLRFEWPAKKAILWRFGHGRYADAWSILHVTTGASIGLFALWLGVSFLVTVTLSLFVLYAYEFWEALIEIVEDVENSIADVAFGIVGVVMVFGANAIYPLTAKSAFAWLVIAGLVDLLLLYIGWRTYLARRVSEKPEDLLPSFKTAAGRKKIHQDRVLFFGSALAAIPIVPLADWLGVLAAALYFVVIIAVTVYWRQKT